MGSGLGAAEGDVDSVGATVGDADGSGAASCDEQAASIRPEAIRVAVRARCIHIVFLIGKAVVACSHELEPLVFILQAPHIIDTFHAGPFRRGAVIALIENSAVRLS